MLTRPSLTSPSLTCSSVLNGSATPPTSHSSEVPTTHSDNRNNPKPHTTIYSQAAIISRTLIVITHSHDVSSTERPSAAHFCTFYVAQLMSSIIPVYGESDPFATTKLMCCLRAVAHISCTQISHSWLKAYCNTFQISLQHAHVTMSIGCLQSFYQIMVSYLMDLNASPAQCSTTSRKMYTISFYYTTPSLT